MKRNLSVLAVCALSLGLLTAATPGEPNPAPEQHRDPNLTPSGAPMDDSWADPVQKHDRDAL